MLRIATAIDNLLNSITMYRLVLYGLLLIASVAILLGFFKLIAFSAADQIVTLFVILVVSVATNFVFSKLLKAATNFESTYITALILFLIFLPASSIKDLQIAAAASFIAIASKYVLAFKRKHIFNPVAISAVILGLAGFGYAIWWVANPYLLIPVTVVGLLIVRKIRKFKLFLTYTATALITMLLFGFKNGVSAQEVLSVGILSYPVIFFGTIMLTEPQTTPPTKKLQIIYAVLVGFLFGAQYHIGPFTATPELALVVGNIFTYFVSSKKLFLKLESKNQIAKDTFEFVFSGKGNFKFTAGQYLEWTLSSVPFDSRGERRYFTIASSPQDTNIKLGIKMYPNPSAFKRRLIEMKKGDVIIASQLSGDFTLSNEKQDRYVFIAGGIGITPFVSIIEDLLNRKIKKDITIFYSNKTTDEIAYKDILKRAEKEINLKVVYLIGEEAKPSNWDGEVGRITETIIQKHVKNINDRDYYLSGPNAMVNSYKELLQKIGVKQSSIHTDYFPGF